MDNFGAERVQKFLEALIQFGIKKIGLGLGGINPHPGPRDAQAAERAGFQGDAGGRGIVAKVENMGLMESGHGRGQL